MGRISGRATRVFIAVVTIAGVLSGCADAKAGPSSEPTGAASSAVPSVTPTKTSPPVTPPAPEPLLTISGTVADTTGQSLAVTLTLVDVRPLTDQDRADVAATACDVPYEPDVLTDPDARMVTMNVDAVGSPGFVPWADNRGVVVSGDVFSGALWRQPAHSPAATCVAPSRIVEPGHGTLRLFASTEYWKVAKPVPSDGSITLATYGFQAQTVDALGQPTGTSEVLDCSITTSQRLDALVQATGTHAVWGRGTPLPEYCFIGRNPGE